MDEREYISVKEYHQRLLHIASQERLIRGERQILASVSLSDRLLLGLGDRLISLGQGLKKRTHVYVLTEECS